ncbi:MAG: aminotransferase class I/II-fold pyridoxal phosphate-dependent enzyme [Bacteroidales bacterium]|jgi:methionine-gamma-lyase|nr:aminotransferase class I/II-fold pyridoxal phosphate-dependent enzyme [Bacteroidales bacterium]
MKKFNPANALQDLSQFGEFGGVNPSVTDSATYTFMQAKTMTDTFKGETEGCFLYSRHWNPSNKYLSDALAAMENTEAGWVTASGMAAITCVILQICNTGDHIISSLTTYGGTFAFLSNYLKKFNIEVDFVNISDLDAVKKAIKPNTKMIYTETMTNPMLQISNLPELSKISKANHLKLVCDNTFTPMIVTPANFGVDVVVYSLTKFVNGKNDCVSGAICSTQEFINSLIDVNTGTAMLLGPAMDPKVSSAILKNLGDLHIRMVQHSKNAMYLANKFKENGIKANYPGLPEFPDHDLLKSMMNPPYGFGGIISIDLGTEGRSFKVMEMMQDEKIGYLAVSLGYFKTLFSNSGKSTSSEIPQDLQEKMGMSEGLVRFSVGLDMDIERTFEKIKHCIDSVK